MDILQTAAERAGGSAAAEAAAMIAARGIGSHVERRGGSLLKTLQGLTTDRPWQIFLGNPMSTKLALKEDDVAASAAHIAATGLRVFVHTPYLINLSAAGAGALLREQTAAAVAAGMSGVVVHVGKSVKMDVAAATEAMRAALAEGAEAATADCPVLLETPAGQGTELLTGWAEFVDFVASFAERGRAKLDPLSAAGLPAADTRIRACVDTCHCFACGHCPLKYIKDTLASHPTLIKLIHFNDSAVACGACVDRHAAPGTGHIGLETLSAIAAVAGEAGIPCVVE
jgi:deoxyribonuclease-4